MHTAQKSAHIDRFAFEHLPPPEQLPEFLFELPELQFPAQLNCATELLDRAIDERGWGERPCMRAPGGPAWSYRQLREQADRIAQVLGDIAAAPANVLFHCTAGKDRTGVIASALLGVLGATPEVIAADYALSTQAMAGIVGWYRSLAGDIPHDPEREQQIVDRAATVATMAGVVEEIERRHGSFAGWARDAGIGDDLIEALRAKLVVS